MVGGAVSTGSGSADSIALMPPASPADREIYTVSQLNTEARILLESGFGTIWVEGELSNVARPSSGHIYFTLKDAGAQVRCAMFRRRGYRLSFQPEEGMQVLVRARVSVYQARGDYQLIVEHLEEAGDGALRRAFEELKQRLAAEGLFDGDHKQQPPTLPKRVGVITSPTGAAIHDILTTLARRFPALPVIVYPVPVQGPGAAEKIARAIALADARQECDVLIVARGGGSLEDLMAFNDEVVARAIYACGIPVVVGVGHEVDITIADFVADQRAPTPTAAAELVSPHRDEWLELLGRFEQRLVRQIAVHLANDTQTLTWLNGRLNKAHPGRRLQERAQRLDESEQRLRLAWRATLREHQASVQHASARLQRHDPSERIRALAAQQTQLAQRLTNSWRRILADRTQHLQSLGRELHAVSPLATLDRGYAIVQTTGDITVVRTWSQVEIGDRVTARLGKGRLGCRIEERSED